MLEVLKQLQVKPRPRGGQVNICNEKTVDDCRFLEGFTFWGFVLRPFQQQAHAQSFPVGLNVPAFSSKMLQGLESLGFTGKMYRYFSVFPKLKRN